MSSTRLNLRSSASFDQVSRVLKTLCTFWKLLRSRREKTFFFTFPPRHFEIQFQILNINSRLLVYSSCSDTIIYIYTFDYYFQARIRIVITHVWPLNSHASRSLQSFFHPLARGRSKLLQHKNTQPRMCANQYQLREKLSPIRVN